MTPAEMERLLKAIDEGLAHFAERHAERAQRRADAAGVSVDELRRERKKDRRKAMRRRRGGDRAGRPL